MSSYLTAHSKFKFRPHYLHMFELREKHRHAVKTAEIYSICKFDIENTYFNSLGQTLHQTRGVPMGSPGSPSYAICICAYYEHLLHEKLRKFEDTTEDLTPTIRGMRYIDDLLTVIAWNKQEPETKQRALTVQHMITNETYHQFMKLKCEDTSKPFTFLEGILNIEQSASHPDKITIKYNNKNFLPLIETGKIKFHTLQHRGPFITKSQAQAKIIGQLHRMEKTVVTKKSLTTAIQEWATIANKLEYKNSEIITAIKTMVTNDPSRWFDIYCNFRNTHKWLVG